MCRIFSAFDAALPHVLGLQLGDHATPLVAQPPGRVEFLVEARRHETAVAHQERRLADQRRIEKPGQLLMPGERALGRRQHLGQLALQHRPQPLGLDEPVANRREIPRPAAVERQPRQRALEVRHPAQQLAHRSPCVGRLDEMRHRVLPRPHQPHVGRRRR